MKNVPIIIDTGKTASGQPYLTLGRCGLFSVRKTFDCGQTFRFNAIDENTVTGVAMNRHITFSQSGETLTIIGAAESEYESTWKSYLTLDEDYAAANEAILDAMPNDEYRQTMQKAVEFGSGIRILRQDPFETLISFIVSQNNNIPRIRKIIAALCEKYGENGLFPAPDALANASVDELYALRTGFRAKYIRDAAVKVASGEVSLAEIAQCDDYDRCTEMLCRINGVGPKVSSCVLLFGFHKTTAFPIDVWMKKSLARHFPDGFDPAPLGIHAGLCQQYLFYFERWNSGNTQ
ncbi:MAG: DNA-3-methyladenine glycosylase 2 family protein [Clostridia bacterium]|nr:DNA-3-methyladenine glycosylase 2 family protein [Clostridia bacterium]